MHDKLFETQSKIKNLITKEKINQINLSFLENLRKFSFMIYNHFRKHIYF
jgi:hypothetical protein